MYENVNIILNDLSTKIIISLQTDGTVIEQFIYQEKKCVDFECGVINIFLRLDLN